MRFDAILVRPLRPLAGAAIALAMITGLPGAAWAQRLALVVGNSAYTAAPPLANARTDAEDMAEALARLDFEVTLLTDIDHAGFLAALDGFAAAAEGAETTLFYFSGHGFQLGGVNYLAPVEATLRDRAAIEDETWRLDMVIGRLQSRNRQTLILLDACRNNPLPASMQGGAPEGLAQPETGANTFVAFATQPNNITLDGRGRNSPFTGALLENIGAPGISVSDMMIRVRNEVELQTLGRQTPWDQSSLRAQFYFKPVMESATGLTGADLEMLAGLDPVRRRQLLQLLAASGVVLDVEAASNEIDELAVEMAAAGPALPFATGVGIVLQDAEPEPPAPPVEVAAAAPPPVTAPVSSPAPLARPAERVVAAEAGAPSAGDDAGERLVIAALPEAARVSPDAAGRTGATRAIDPAATLPEATRAIPEAAAGAPTAAARPDAARAVPDTASARAPAAGIAPVPPRPEAPQPQAADGGARVIAALPPERATADPARPQRIIGTTPEPEAPAAAAPEPEEAPALAAAPQPEAPAEPLEPVPANLARAVQAELQRLGCYRAGVDGIWGPMSSQALVRYVAQRDLIPDSLDPTEEIWRALRAEDEVVCRHTETVTRTAAARTPTPTAPEATQPTRPTLGQRAPSTTNRPAAQQPASPARTMRGNFR